MPRSPVGTSLRLAENPGAVQHQCCYAALIGSDPHEPIAPPRQHRPEDLYFSLEKILAANARFPSLLPLLPSSLPYLHIDTTCVSPDRAYTLVDSFLGTPAADA